MFSIFMVALLAHLVGDYLLQNNFLFTAKSRSLLGAGIHLLIVILVTCAAIIGVFGVASWPLAVILSAGHLLIDTIKPLLLKKIKHNNILYYLFDQGLHIATLILAAKIGSAHVSPLGEETLFIVRVLTLVLISTFFCSLTCKVALTSIYPRYYAKRPAFERGERPVDMIYGLSVFVALYAIPFWYLYLPVLLIFSLLYFFISTAYLHIPLPASVIKLVMSLSIVAAFTTIL